jgi:hypothetical protein
MEPVFRSARADAKANRNVKQEFPQSAKTPPKGGAFVYLAKVLQRRFNLKTPGFEQSLRDIFGIFITPRPLP